MPRRLDKALVDYLVIAIIPALVMALVGSLVFFLLAVCYQGQYEARLHFIFAMFVMATVLVARIAMTDGAEYATLFAVPLAVAAGLAMLRFVTIQGPLAPLSWLINFALLALVWWSAHKLTWDCTLIDERQDASGQGLLDTAGLEGDRQGPSHRASEEEPQVPEPSGTTSREPPPRSFWHRYVQHQHRPHAPGVWVVYFSLAALPLFGFGQWFIPRADLAGRRYAFQLLCVYVASGLALLLTTSFLGLRRYLRQRQIEMSTQIARLWLLAGSILIVVIMVLCALVPRPSAEYSISQLPIQLRSPQDLKPSPMGYGDTGPRQEQPAERRSPERGQETTHDTANADSDNDAPPTTQSGESRRDRSGQSRPEQADGPAAQDEHLEHDDDAIPDSGQRPDRQSRDVPSDETERAPNTGRSASTAPPQGEFSPSGASAHATLSASSFIAQLGATLATGLKLLFYAAAVVVAAYLVWRHWDRIREFLLALLSELQDIWNRLFGRRGYEKPIDQPDIVSTAASVRPFSDFADPFASATGDRYSLEELIRYSFEALEAWAYEHDCARQPDQTPHEFAQRVAAREPSVGGEARRLAALYSRVAYAQGTLPPSSIEPIRSLWRQLRQSSPAVSLRTVRE
jgi:hypothetical protein